MPAKKIWSSMGSLGSVQMMERSQGVIFVRGHGLKNNISIRGFVNLTKTVFKCASAASHCSVQISLLVNIVQTLARHRGLRRLIWVYVPIIKCLI